MLRKPFAAILMFAAIAGGGLLLASYWVSNSSTNGTIIQAGVQKFSLAVSEREQLETAALHGDSEAALRLHEFYLFVHLNDSEADRWLQRSAELGNRQAVLLLIDDFITYGNLDKAGTWIERGTSRSLEKNDETMLESLATRRALVTQRRNPVEREP